MHLEMVNHGQGDPLDFSGGAIERSGVRITKAENNANPTPNIINMPYVYEVEPNCRFNLATRLIGSKTHWLAVASPNDSSEPPAYFHFVSQVIDAASGLPITPDNAQESGKSIYIPETDNFIANHQMHVFRLNVRGIMQNPFQLFRLVNMPVNEFSKAVLDLC